ncbi:alpha-ketoglutarate-dependent taurine dioxygenase [Obelidium mucronatum]|nr:alpha-ketoglutarate-dependent taurine dioxygenase [Obelidium mucronatum]
MSPVETQQLANATAALSLKAQNAGPLKVQPLKRNFSLNAFKSFKLQPHIGTEFEQGTIQIRDILKAPNADELIKDFAVLTSERNVMLLLRSRPNLLTVSDAPQGSPLLRDFTLTQQPTWLMNLVKSATDINSEKLKRYGGEYGGRTELASAGWHSDITFEHVPSDYASLRLRSTPPEGGDTLWASAYEVYERLSPAFKKFLEGLTATHVGEGFLKLAAAGIVPIHAGPRGAPEDVGTDLTAIHPLPDGRESLPTEDSPKRINELSKDESDLVLEYLFNLAVQNHDLQVRFRWNKHDVAVWDNRSAFHTATVDFDIDSIHRLGDRATSLGERPYYDPNSTSRREALGIAPPVARRAHLAALAAKSV